MRSIQVFAMTVFFVSAALLGPVSAEALSGHDYIELKLSDDSVQRYLVSFAGPLGFEGNQLTQQFKIRGIVESDPYLIAKESAIDVTFNIVKDISGATYLVPELASGTSPSGLAIKTSKFEEQFHTQEVKPAGTILVHYCGETGAVADEENPILVTSICLGKTE